MKAARFVRALAVGAAMSAMVACERAENSERPNSFSSGNSQPVEQPSASADAGATPVAVEPTTSGSSDPSAAVVAGAACSPVGAVGSQLRPNGLVPCECVASAANRAQWECNERGMIMEGPLPPPELALG